MSVPDLANSAFVDFLANVIKNVYHDPANAGIRNQFGMTVSSVNFIFSGNPQTQFKHCNFTPGVLDVRDASQNVMISPTTDFVSKIRELIIESFNDSGYKAVYTPLKNTDVNGKTAAEVADEILSTTDVINILKETFTAPSTATASVDRQVDVTVGSDSYFLFTPPTTNQPKVDCFTTRNANGHLVRINKVLSMEFKLFSGAISHHLATKSALLATVKNSFDVVNEDSIDKAKTSQSAESFFQRFFDFLKSPVGIVVLAVAIFAGALILIGVVVMIVMLMSKNKKKSSKKTNNAPEEEFVGNGRKRSPPLEQRRRKVVIADEEGPPTRSRTREPEPRRRTREPEPEPRRRTRATEPEPRRPARETEPEPEPRRRTRETEPPLPVPISDQVKGILSNEQFLKGTTGLVNAVATGDNKAVGAAIGTGVQGVIPKKYQAFAPLAGALTQAAVGVAANRAGKKASSRAATTVVKPERVNMLAYDEGVGRYSVFNSASFI